MTEERCNELLLSMSQYLNDMKEIGGDWLAEMNVKSDEVVDIMRLAGHVLKGYAKAPKAYKQAIVAGAVVPPNMRPPIWELAAKNYLRKSADDLLKKLNT